jgi:hypothetical protein
MDMYVTFYAHQLDLPTAEYLKLIDVITLWMWKSEELADLRRHLTRLDKLAPHSRKMLGVYTVALTKREPRPGRTCPSPHAKAVRVVP